MDELSKNSKVTAKLFLKAMFSQHLIFFMNFHKHLLKKYLIVIHRINSETHHGNDTVD